MPTKRFSLSWERLLPSAPTEIIIKKNVNAKIRVNVFRNENYFTSKTKLERIMQKSLYYTNAWAMLYAAYSNKK